ncbi:TonB-dependent receptor [Porticoccus sp. W117]|uniref:TonB-dependent receptor n=1 Tax=Porticoccus sp. W117 TaxID=3054777 RepID=UPI0025974B05|nr:TonB-dependent receptor [Porticoccus sp. W117]MDM3871826.1 TonB-dependent receptor [Porticoccus sp. W117]
MKQNILASKSLLALAVGTISAQAYAQNTQQPQTSIDEEVIITASPVHGDKDKVIQGISILSGDELREQAAATLGETLQGELGISSSSFGPGVGLPVIRGQSANRVKVLQNSLDTLDASDTSPDHASGTESLLAERIEVLRGPSTLRFGNGAIGGVVNVIDNRIPESVPESVESAVEVRHNSANSGDNLVFKVDGGEGNIAWHLDGLYRSSNNIQIDGPAMLEHEEEEHEGEEEHEEEETTIGFVDNTDANTNSLTGGLSWVGEDRFVGFSVSRLENNYGIPPGAHGHEEEEGEEGEEEEEIIRIDLEQTRYDFRAGLNNPWEGIEQLSFGLAYNDYRHVELEGAEQGTVFTNDAWESRLELVHEQWGNWKGAFGLQLQMADFAAVGEEAFVAPADISNYGVFWLEDMNIDDWHIELGVRAERQQIDPINGAEVSHTTTTLSGAAQWLFADNQHLSFSLTNAERAPTVEELFSEGAHLATNQFIFGNSALDEETSLNYELGYHYHSEAVTLQAFVFYNDISDFIYELGRGTEMEELPVFDYVQQDATFQGAEAELNIALNEELTLNLFGDYVRAELNDGSDVPRITPARFGTELEYGAGEWSAKLRWTEVQDQDRPGDEEEPTEGYSRVDTSLSYQIDGNNADYTLFLRGSNLLNEDIRDATSFLREFAPQAGRSFELGVRVTF